MSASSNPLKEPTAGKMPRGDFIKTSAAAGATGSVLAGPDAASAQGATSAQDSAGGGRMKIGINLEYVRHGDKSLAYGIKTAGHMGYQWVEPCLLMGRCLLSRATTKASSALTLEGPKESNAPRTRPVLTFLNGFPREGRVCMANPQFALSEEAYWLQCPCPRDPKCQTSHNQNRSEHQNRSEWVKQPVDPANPSHGLRRIAQFAGGNINGNVEALASTDG